MPSDGRLFFIEDGKHVRVIQDGSLLPDAASSANPLPRYPASSSTRNSRARGTSTSVSSNPDPMAVASLSVVRYREVGNALGEGAVIVAGLPFVVGRDASLAVDADRRLYVALPATAVGDPRADRYAGMVLRFEDDGTAVRADGAAAPVFSPGYSEPTSLVWSREGNRLWLAGRDAAWTGTLASLSLDAATPRSAVPERIASPRTPRSRTSPFRSQPLVDVTAMYTRLPFSLMSRRRIRVVATPGGIVTTPWIAPNELGDRVVGAAGGVRDNDLFLLLTGQGDPTTLSSRIVRLRR